MFQLKHWQDPVNGALGAWLLLSPWILGYNGEAAAMPNAVIVGIALVAAALGAMLLPRAWEEWTEAALGLWLMASPWVLRFNGNADAMLTAVITGLVVLVLAAWTLLTDEEYSRWWHRAAH